MCGYAGFGERMGGAERMTEPWLEAERRQARLERELARRPVCADCGRPVTGERYFPLEDGALCEQCVRFRMQDIFDDEF